MTGPPLKRKVAPTPATAKTFGRDLRILFFIEEVGLRDPVRLRASCDEGCTVAPHSALDSTARECAIFVKDPTTYPSE